MGGGEALQDCAPRAHSSNRPSPSCIEPHSEIEVSCIVFVMKIRFHSYANRLIFLRKALHLASLSL